MRKSPTGRAGRALLSEGVEVREVAALVRNDSGTAGRLGSDFVLSAGNMMIVREETKKKQKQLRL